MFSPVESAAGLVIGSVESVSPDNIKVLLELDAPQAMALNTGVPHGFPRINGYVLVPNETGALVGMIVWLGIERSPFPKRTGMRDFGLIDLPYPLRKLVITPLGTLVQTKGENDSQHALRLERGVFLFPSVGDSVLLPTKEQLRSIVEAADPKDRRVLIGTSPLASNAKITVDPNKIFGRHLAVLGNTGSGKSCSVAGMIRWSLKAAEGEKKRQNEGVNARFIVLDPNGEYSSAFRDLVDEGKARVFRVPPVDAPFHKLTVPAWMWNSQEWCAFTDASPKVQRPVLMGALRELRSAGSLLDSDSEESLGLKLRRRARSLGKDLHGAPESIMDFPAKKNLCQKLHAYAAEFMDFSSKYCAHDESLKELAKQITNIANRRGKITEDYPRPFCESDLQEAIQAIDDVLMDFPTAVQSLSASEDSPTPFNVEDLEDCVQQLALDQSQPQFVDTLLLRIRMLLSDDRLKPVVSPEDEPDLAGWLNDFLGKDGAENGQVAVVDLSLISSDVLHTIIAVTARIVFEATQRYRRMNQKELPSVIVLEEAHSFIRRGKEREDEGNPSPAEMCRNTFERIAREGRKFGLGLVLSSQRPWELPPTVLAQCNTFLLHRIVNDRDQELVAKLVPDNLGGLLGELPSLPSRQAILLGWAVPVPVLVEMTELPLEHRPSSADPHFWEVWTGLEERKIDWKPIVNEWTGLGVGETTESEPEVTSDDHETEEAPPEDCNVNDVF